MNGMWGFAVVGFEEGGKGGGEVMRLLGEVCL